MGSALMSAVLRYIMAEFFLDPHGSEEVAASRNADRQTERCSQLLSHVVGERRERELCLKGWRSPSSKADSQRESPHQKRGRRAGSVVSAPVIRIGTAGGRLRKSISQTQEQKCDV